MVPLIGNSKLDMDKYRILHVKQHFYIGFLRKYRGPNYLGCSYPLLELVQYNN